MVWSSPRTWVAGEIPTASIFNTHVRDNLKAIGDPWTAYTPTLSNWTLGNGTLTGFYLQAGKLVIGKVFLTLGSTTTPSGNLVISLPVAKLTEAGQTTPLHGNALAFDTSGSATNIVFPAHSTTTAMRFYTAAAGLVTATVPWTWANGDQLNADFMYEAA